MVRTQLVVGLLNSIPIGLLLVVMRAACRSLMAILVEMSLLPSFLLYLRRHLQAWLHGLVFN